MNLNLYIIIEAVTLVLMLHDVCPTLAAFRNVTSTTFKKTYVAGDNITSYSTGKEVGRSIIQCSDLCKADGNGCAGFRFDGKSCHFYSAVDPALLAPTKSGIKTIAFYYIVYDPKDCQAYWEIGHRESGVYGLSPPGGVQSFLAWCEFDDNHGWTVIQRRLDGSQDFFLYWSDYKNGFGNIRGEYWLGNDNIYALTSTNRKLSIYLRRYDGQEGTANYSTFYINNEADNYRLTISGYSGSVGDKMAFHNNYQFSTRDRDHDVYNSGNCAVSWTGAWWYKSCLNSHLNGVWTSSSSGGRENMVWLSSWGGNPAPLQRTTMMVTRG